MRCGYVRERLLLMRCGYVRELAPASYPHIHGGGDDFPALQVAVAAVGG
jgi:hypothetical protein